MLALHSTTVGPLESVFLPELSEVYFSINVIRNIYGNTSDCINDLLKTCKIDIDIIINWQVQIVLHRFNRCIFLTNRKCTIDFCRVDDRPVSGTIVDIFLSKYLEVNSPCRSFLFSPS